MRRNIIYIFILIITFAFNIGSYAGSYKAIAKDDYGKADKLQQKLLKNKELQPFIPYKNYHEGANSLINAAHQFEEEKEYELASYYAVLAKVEFATAKFIARTRLLRYKILLAERDEYKNAAKKEMLKGAISGANLVKRGKSYCTNIEDKIIFKRRSLKMLSKGEMILNKIYQVIKLYPESRLIIKGHTSKRDRNNKRSKQKADKVAEYFIMTKGVDEKRIDAKGIGNQEPLEVRGRDRRINRVEIVILGVKDN